VVSEARKYKIRLILSLVNNWEAYGGKPQYVKWGNAAGLNLTSDDDFFSHPTLRSYYKAHVKASSFLQSNRTKTTFCCFFFLCDAAMLNYLIMNTCGCGLFPCLFLLTNWFWYYFSLCRRCSIELIHSQISLTRKIQQFLLGN